jgi:hypothetical protein
VRERTPALARELSLEGGVAIYPSGSASHGGAIAPAPKVVDLVVMCEPDVGHEVVEPAESSAVIVGDAGVWFNNRRLLKPIGNIPPRRPKPATTLSLRSPPRAA